MGGNTVPFLRSLFRCASVSLPIASPGWGCRSLYTGDGGTAPPFCATSGRRWWWRGWGTGGGSDCDACVEGILPFGKVSVLCSGGGGVAGGLCWCDGRGDVGVSCFVASLLPVACSCPLSLSSVNAHNRQTFVEKRLKEARLVLGDASDVTPLLSTHCM